MVDQEGRKLSPNIHGDQAKLLNNPVCSLTCRLLVTGTQRSVGWSSQVVFPWLPTDVQRGLRGLLAFQNDQLVQYACMVGPDSTSKHNVKRICYVRRDMQHIDLRAQPIASRPGTQESCSCKIQASIMKPVRSSKDIHIARMAAGLLRAAHRSNRHDLPCTGG